MRQRWLWVRQKARFQQTCSLRRESTINNKIQVAELQVAEAAISVSNKKLSSLDVLKANHKKNITQRRIPHVYRIPDTHPYILGVFYFAFSIRKWVHCNYMQLFSYVSISFRFAFLIWEYFFPLRLYRCILAFEFILLFSTSGRMHFHFSIFHFICAQRQTRTRIRIRIRIRIIKIIIMMIVWATETKQWWQMIDTLAEYSGFEMNQTLSGVKMCYAPDSHWMNEFVYTETM